MTLREELEKKEHIQLSLKAAFSDESRGRNTPEEPGMKMCVPVISGIRIGSSTVNPSAGLCIRRRCFCARRVTITAPV